MECPLLLYMPVWKQPGGCTGQGWVLHKTRDYVRLCSFVFQPCSAPEPRITAVVRLPLSTYYINYFWINLKKKDLKRQTYVTHRQPFIHSLYCRSADELGHLHFHQSLCPGSAFKSSNHKIDKPTLSCELAQMNRLDYGIEGMCRNT